jgi:hypothetical protein
VKTAVPADGGPVRLVRPDGYIAWAADTPTAEDVASAIAAAGAQPEHPTARPSSSAARPSWSKARPS